LLIAYICVVNLPETIYFSPEFASASAEIDFASVSTEIDIPSGAVACQEENTRKRYLYLLHMKCDLLI
jgi:hypothetical protein